MVKCWIYLNLIIKDSQAYRFSVAIELLFFCVEGSFEKQN